MSQLPDIWIKSVCVLSDLKCFHTLFQTSNYNSCDLSGCWRPLQVDVWNTNIVDSLCLEWCSIFFSKLKYRSKCFKTIQVHTAKILTSVLTFFFCIYRWAAACRRIQRRPWDHYWRVYWRMKDSFSILAWRGNQWILWSGPSGDEPWLCQLAPLCPGADAPLPVRTYQEVGKATHNKSKTFTISRE